MSKIDLDNKNYSATEEARLLKLFAEYAFDLGNLYIGISSCKLKKIINQEFSRIYDLTREIMNEKKE